MSYYVNNCRKCLISPIHSYRYSNASVNIMLRTHLLCNLCSELYDVICGRIAWSELKCNRIVLTYYDGLSSSTFLVPRSALLKSAVVFREFPCLPTFISFCELLGAFLSRGQLRGRSCQVILSRGKHVWLDQEFESFWRTKENLYINSTSKVN